MIIMGIDPGLSGGIVILHTHTGQLLTFTMPIKQHSKKRSIEPEGVIDIIDMFKPDVAILEEVHAMPGQGVTSMFTFGLGYGLLIGILKAKNIKSYLVSPRVWQKMVSLGRGYEEAVDQIKQLFPDVSFKMPRAKKDHDGLLDAACLAWYGASLLDKDGSMNILTRKVA